MSRSVNKIYQVYGVLSVVVAVITALLLHVVQADDFTRRVYINGGIGITQLEPESSADSLTISDKSDAGGHLAVGYDITRFLTVEGYAASLGNAQVEFLGTDAGSVDYTVFGVSALGYLYNSRSGLVFGDDDTSGLYRREGASLYARLGVGHLQNDSTRVDYRRDYPNHVAYGVGLEYGFSNGVGLRTELVTFDTDAQYLNVGILKRFGRVAAAPALAAAALPALSSSGDSTVEPVSEPVTAPAQIPNSFIYFEVDEADLSPESERTLDVLASSLLESDQDVLIEGHTDWLATETYNMSLSVRRAEAVGNYLYSKGVPRDRVTLIGYGETRPLSNNNTEEGRALNRRVEIIFD